ncbi:hypothetical protein PUNSTDRAFT_34244, partial [Punctularia strigosozonata HHB-11173 SS5]
IIVTYTLECASRGFPLSRRRLQDHAEKILRARLGGSFPQDGLGINWSDRFIERNNKHLKKCWSRPLDGKRG